MASRRRCYCRHLVYQETDSFPKYLTIFADITDFSPRVSTIPVHIATIEIYVYRAMERLDVMFRACRTVPVDYVPWRERVDEFMEAELLDFEFYENEEWRQLYIVPIEYLNPLIDPHPASSIDSSGHVPGPGGSLDPHLVLQARPPKRKAEDQLFGRANKIARSSQSVEIDYRIHHRDGFFRPTMRAVRRSTAEYHCYGKSDALDPGSFASVAARDDWAIEPWLRRDRARRLRRWALNVQYTKAKRQVNEAYKASHPAEYRAYMVEYKAYMAHYRASMAEYKAAYREAGRAAYREALSDVDLT